MSRKEDIQKISKVHLDAAIEEIDKTGVPNGRQSFKYDLVVGDKHYPPLLVVSIANRIANGIEFGPNTLGGGPSSESFKLLEREGFQILEKSENLEYYQIKEDFLTEWPIERLQSMPIEDYTNLDKTSFCYWLESLSTSLGSIWGGSAYKFGIYKRDNVDKEDKRSAYYTDKIYAWVGKYGNTREEAFHKVRQIIIEIANAAKENRLEDILKQDIGDAVKWKIAFIYGDFNVINLFKYEALLTAANYLNYRDEPKDWISLNNYILSTRGVKDYFELSKELWAVYDAEKSQRTAFENWLKKESKVESGKISSYLRSLKILDNHFRIEIYTETDISILKELYEDLLLYQKDPNGKYAYKSKSYGDGGYYSAAVGEYIKFISETNRLITRSIQNIMTPYPLNQILYGPPGTGKTYSTIDKVVEICHADYIHNDHEHNKILFDQLVKEGRVVFTTFHQSMSYEDFIEGIKPVKPGDDDTFLKYDIEPGVFKQISNTAKTPTKVQSSNVDWDSVNYYKMSIGGKNRPDIHNWCIENNVVGLSWGGEEDLSSLITEVGVKWENYRDSFRSQFPKTAEENRYNIQASYILNKMKIGDIVVISKGNHIIDAIGKITGEYFFDDATPSDMYHFRKVEWIVKDMEAAPEKFIDKQISQQSIYEFYNDDVKKEAFKSLTSKTKVEDKPYVLVIDEINRGNISAIFGELITLIEDDKRLGAKNELTVTLPYSKEKFGVPSNLYIIGTMNTADRSVEALDTALRRRFTFEEMLPDPSLLKETIEGISLEKLLRTINERIEVLVDRDHTIGHAFFINDTTLDHLRNTFANKVIPLLQEYFYGDYSKMEMVIGSAFFYIKGTNKVKFAVNSNNFDPEGKVYHIKNIASKEVISDDYFKNALNQILNTED